MYIGKLREKVLNMVLFLFLSMQSILHSFGKSEPNDPETEYYLDPPPESEQVSFDWFE